MILGKSGRYRWLPTATRIDSWFIPLVTGRYSWSQTGIKNVPADNSEQEWQKRKRKARTQGYDPGKEETKLFYDRLRDAFEARFEPAAIYDRAGNQLRFLNRKTSGRYVFHGGAPRASNYKSDDNLVGFLPPTSFLVSLPPSLAFSNLSIYPSASPALSLSLTRPLSSFLSSVA